MEKKAKKEKLKAEEAAGRNASILIDAKKSLFQDEHYVVKIIDVSHLSQKDQAEAFNEIETMQKLNCPYIVGYYDSFINEDIYDPKLNLVIEYCQNGDLFQFLEKKEKTKLKEAKYLNENTIWRIFINICIGLEYLHSLEIIHRDLKTLNIFMTRDNVAKIGDLGCAQSVPADVKGQEAEGEKQVAGDSAVPGDEILQNSDEHKIMAFEDE